jgi:hypothetical protein
MLSFLWGDAAAEEPAAPEDGSKSLRAWLDAIKPGYGDRFAEAFSQIGVEDTDDFLNFDEEMYVLLEAELRRCGAKWMQLRYIQQAIHDHLGPRRHVGSNNNPRTQRVRMPSVV